jgi:hypothetical protein
MRRLAVVYRVKRRRKRSAENLLDRTGYCGSPATTSAAATASAAAATRTAAAARAEVVAVRDVRRHCRIAYAQRVRIGRITRRQMANRRLLHVGRIARTRIWLTRRAHLRRIELRVQQRFVLWRHAGDFTAASEKSENAAQTECTQDGVHDELLPSVEAAASESRSHAEERRRECACLRLLTAGEKTPAMDCRPRQRGSPRRDSTAVSSSGGAYMVNTKI